MNKVHQSDYLEANDGTIHTERLKPDHTKLSSSLVSSEPPLLKRILVVDDSPDIVFK